jgi:hypothetical protein
MVLTVATEERRSRKWEKLTPRLPRPADRAATGGLLGQCELTKEERDVDRRLMDTERRDGVLRSEDRRDTAELRLELLRRAWTYSKLPVW